jgi:hypothetical protein
MWVGIFCKYGYAKSIKPSGPQIIRNFWGPESYQLRRYTTGGKLEGSMSVYIQTAKVILSQIGFWTKAEIGFRADKHIVALKDEWADRSIRGGVVFFASLIPDRPTYRFIITLEHSDTYQVELWQPSYNSNQYQLVSKFNDVYCDMLDDILLALAQMAWEAAGFLF